MNRMDLVEKIAEKNAISKAEANRILGTVIEEVMAAVSENFPDKIEFEPSKFARFDPESGEWVYIAPDGTKVMITI